MSLTKFGREKIGDDLNLNWKEYVFGVQKTRRKTIGYGPQDPKTKEYEHEIFLRQISFLDGGLGCAVWDAAIILSRFFYKFGNELLKEKKIFEFGSGVGLPALVCGLFAQKVYLSDYTHPVVDNFKHNIFINGNTDCDECENNPKKLEKKNKLKSSCEGIFLDWNEISELKKIPNFFCENGEGYNNHQNIPSDLLALQKKFESLPHFRFDMLIGSELVYCGAQVLIDNLIENIEFFTKKNAIFLQILSRDRDGVDYFYHRMTEEKGWRLEIFPIAEEYQKNLFKITKQRPEEYDFYLLSKTDNEDTDEKKEFVKYLEFFKQCLKKDVNLPHII